MDKYPLPAYAVSMWTVGDDLLIAFPGINTTRGHTIKLPASPAGFATAISIMRERTVATNLRIGHKASPTQYDLEAIGKYMASDKARKAKAERAASAAELAEATAFLKELGL